MPYCPNCKAEYEDWVQTCADCGVPLVTTRPPAGSEFVRSMFRPLGALQQEQEQARLVPPLEQPPSPSETDNEASVPFQGRYAGRNQRLKGRHGPQFIPTPELLVMPPLAPDAVLPMNINFNLHGNSTVADEANGSGEHTYDRSGDAWVLLTTAPNEIMAHLLRSQLADNGIPALVKMGAAVDSGQFTNNAWVMRGVWVQARDAQRGREVMDFYHGDGPLVAKEDGDTVAPNAQRAVALDEADQVPQYELPWLPNEHYDDRDMVAANASVDERGRPLQRDEYRSPIQRSWFRWLSFILLLAWTLPYIIELLGHIGTSLSGIFGGR